MKKITFKRRGLTFSKKKMLIVCFILLIIIAGVLFFIFQNKDKEKDLSTIVEEKSTAYRTDLEDSASTFTSNEKIEDYLCNWAKSKGIKYENDSHGNVIMSVKSSKAYKSAPPTTIVCTYDSKQIKTCLDPMAVALYLAKNNESTGKLSVIFTASDGNDFQGIQSLNSKYFTDSTNVFCLNGGNKAMFATSTGAMSSYTLTNSIKTTSPTGNKALKIKISGLPGGTPDGRISSYPNPVKTLSDLLAFFKTNAYIYELGSISGGNAGGVYPQSAEMTIVINTDTLEKYTTRLDKEIEDFVKDYEEDYPDATYTYKEVKVPDTVFTEESNNKFISLMYTLQNGVYLRDTEDNLISITNIGSLKQNDSKISINVSANSLSDDNLKDIDDSQKTICSLSNANYKKNYSIGTWQSKDDTEFAMEVATAFKEFSGYKMEYGKQVATTNANFIHKKNNKCNIMSISLYQEKISRYAGTLVTFLINQEHTEQ